MSSEENSFAITLEKLALKKSSNNEVFEHVKKLFDAVLKEKHLKNLNEKINFTSSKDNSVSKYEALDTSVMKLRKKYNNLKTEWRKITDRAKSGSGLAPQKEPQWYIYLNDIFSETNEDLDLAAESADLSFSCEHTENYGEEEDMSRSDSLSSESEPDLEIERKQKRTDKVVAAPHKKRKAIRSQQQALSHLANSVEQMASSQAKKHRLTIEADLKRDEMYLKHKEEENQRNREHELRLAEIYARAMSGRKQQNDEYAPRQNFGYPGSYEQLQYSPSFIPRMAHRSTTPSFSQEMSHTSATAPFSPP